MNAITVRDMRDGYVDLVRTVLNDGFEVSPRGVRTLELHGPTVIRLFDPTDAYPRGVGRDPTLGIALAEAAHLVGGVSNAQQLAAIAPNFSRFTENERLRGAYGPRAHHQFPRVIETLRRDPESRQASVTIWSGRELEGTSKDVPCTHLLSYSIRGGKLHATTVMRSNDVFWGVPYDFAMFTLAQRAVAWSLGVPLGEYTHVAFSMHAYVDRDEKGFAKLHDYDHRLVSMKDGEEWPDFPGGDLMKMQEGDELVRWRLLAAAMASLADPQSPALSTVPFVRWAGEIIRPKLDDSWQLCGGCRFVLPIARFNGHLCDRCAW